MDAILNSFMKLYVLTCPHCNRKCGMYMTKKEYSAYYNIKAKIQCRGCEKSYEIVPNSKKGTKEEISQ